MELSRGTSTISAINDHGDIPCFSHLVTMEQNRRRKEREQTIQKLESQEKVTLAEKQWLKIAKTPHLWPHLSEPRRELKLIIEFVGEGERKIGTFKTSEVTRNYRQSTVASLSKMDFPTVLGLLQNLKQECKNTEKEIKKMKQDHNSRLLQEEKNNLLDLQSKLKGFIQLITSVLKSVRNTVRNYEEIDFNFTDFHLLVRKIDSKRRSIVTKTIELIQDIPVTRKIRS